MLDGFVKETKTKIWLTDYDDDYNSNTFVDETKILCMSLNAANSSTVISLEYCMSLQITILLFVVIIIIDV